MESLVFLSDLLTAHEPPTATLTPTLSHRMGEGARLVRRSLGEGGRAGEGGFMGSLQSHLPGGASGLRCRMAGDQRAIRMRK
jgi:hypothetical protein